MSDDIIVPFVPNTIITNFKEDYPYIQELLEYKRDGTLAFLKSQGAIAIYNGSLGLDVKHDVKSWGDFIEFSKSYTKKFVQEGLQKYQNAEKNVEDNKKKFIKLDLEILGDAIVQISKYITDDYLRKFPQWPTSGTQEGFLDILLKNQFESNNLKFYWACRGTIFVKDTKYDYPRNGCPYNAEWSGKPEFQLAFFDLEKIRQCNEIASANMAQMKQIVEKYEQKIIEQSFRKLLTNIDMLEI